MQDGRAFTDYRSNCLLVAELQQESGIYNEYEFRQYLQDESEIYPIYYDAEYDAEYNAEYDAEYDE